MASAQTMSERISIGGALKTPTILTVAQLRAEDMRSATVNRRLDGKDVPSTVRGVPLTEAEAITPVHSPLPVATGRPMAASRSRTGRSGSWLLTTPTKRRPPSRVAAASQFRVVRGKVRSSSAGYLRRSSGPVWRLYARITASATPTMTLKACASLALQRA